MKNLLEFLVFGTALLVIPFEFFAGEELVLLALSAIYVLYVRTYRWQLYPFYAVLFARSIIYLSYEVFQKEPSQQGKGIISIPIRREIYWRLSQWRLYWRSHTTSHKDSVLVRLQYAISNTISF